MLTPSRRHAAPHADFPGRWPYLPISRSVRALEVGALERTRF